MRNGGDLLAFPSSFFFFLSYVFLQRKWGWRLVILFLKYVVYVYFLVEDDIGRLMSWLGHVSSFGMVLMVSFAKPLFTNLFAFTWMLKLCCIPWLINPCTFYSTNVNLLIDTLLGYRLISLNVLRDFLKCFIEKGLP